MRKTGVPGRDSFVPGRTLRHRAGMAAVGFNAQHTSKVSFVGQNLNQNIVNIVYDPLVADEMAETEQFLGEADLLAHFQAPLVDGNDVYMMYKAGTFNPKTTRRSSGARRSTPGTGAHTALNVAWQFASDWNAPGSQLRHLGAGVPSRAGQRLALRARQGRLGVAREQVDRRGHAHQSVPQHDGEHARRTRRHQPDHASTRPGNIYYTAVQLNDDVDFFHDDIEGAWLVKITPSNA